MLDEMLPRRAFTVSCSLEGYLECKGRHASCAHIIAARGSMVPDEGISDLLRMDIGCLSADYMRQRMMAPTGRFLRGRTSLARPPSCLWHWLPRPTRPLL